MLVGIVLMLYFHEYLQKGQNYLFYFLWLGICTVYFNELSFPMISFGMPIVVWLLLEEERGWSSIKKELLLGICWGTGYGLMWMGKWICAGLLTGYNYFAEALGQASRYTSDHATWEVENPTYFERVWKNMSMYMKWPFFVLIVLVLIFVVIYLFNATRKSVREYIKDGKHLARRIIL